MVEMLRTFPRTTDDTLERQKEERDMLRVIDALCSDVHPENLRYALLCFRFAGGLNGKEKELFATKGYLFFEDNCPVIEGGRTPADVKHFWEYGRWPNQWPLVPLTLHEVKNACNALLSLEDKTESQKEQFAVYGEWGR